MMFSVIIPTYNRSAVVVQAVQSVLEQSWNDFEVIVVDDGSTDDTRQRIEGIADNRVKYLHKQNEERGAARNFGAAAARGKYLIFLDSDDRLKKDHLKGVHEFLVQEQFVPQIIFTGFEVVNDNGTVAYTNARSGKLPRNLLYFGNRLGCSPVVISNSLFSQHEFNPNRKLALFEDWELWLRVTSRTPLYAVPLKSVIMHNHAGRSVLGYSAAQYEVKARYLREDVWRECPEIKSSFVARRTFLMGLHSYLALHISMLRGERGATLKHLGIAMMESPGLIFKRRFYATIRHLF